MSGLNRREEEGYEWYSFVNQGYFCLLKKMDAFVNWDWKILFHKG